MSEIRTPAPPVGAEFVKNAADGDYFLQWGDKEESEKKNAYWYATGDQGRVLIMASMLADMVTAVKGYNGCKVEGAGKSRVLLHPKSGEAGIRILAKKIISAGKAITEPVAETGVVG